MPATKPARIAGVLPMNAKGRKCYANVASDPPQDCDAPFCGCNPVWSEALEMLQECGWVSASEAEAKAAQARKQALEEAAQKYDAQIDELARQDQAMLREFQARANGAEAVNGVQFREGLSAAAWIADDYATRAEQDA